MPHWWWCMVVECEGRPLPLTACHAACKLWASAAPQPRPLIRALLSKYARRMHATHSGPVLYVPTCYVYATALRVSTTIVYTNQ